MVTRSFVAILIGIPYYNVPEYFWQAVGLVPGYIYVPQGLPDQVIEADNECARKERGVGKSFERIRYVSR